MLLKLKEEKPTLTTLCGIHPGQAEANFRGWGLMAQDAKLLAPEIAVSAELTSLDVGYNGLQDDGTVTLCNALSENKASKLQELRLAGNGITENGSKSVAACGADRQA